MRRILFATVAAAALCSGVAHAQGITVNDPAGLIQQLRSLQQQVQSYATQIQQLQQAVQEVQWLDSEYHALVANPNFGAVLGLMNQFGIQDPLPVNPATVMSMINGQGGINGALGSLSTFANSAATTNRVYAPTDGTWASQQTIANANGIAGAQGIAQQVYQQMADRFPVIQGLQQELLTAQTPAQREGLMAQIQAQQAWVQNSQGQLQTASLMLSAEQQSRVQQSSEETTKSLDGQLQQARAAGIIQ